jgi:hypothetical protein
MTRSFLDLFGTLVLYSKVGAARPYNLELSANEGTKTAFQRLLIFAQTKETAEERLRPNPPYGKCHFGICSVFL